MSGIEDDSFSLKAYLERTGLGSTPTLPLFSAPTEAQSAMLELSPFTPEERAQLVERENLIRVNPPEAQWGTVTVTEVNPLNGSKEEIQLQVPFTQEELRVLDDVRRRAAEPLFADSKERSGRPREVLMGLRLPKERQLLHRENTVRMIMALSLKADEGLAFDKGDFFLRARPENLIAVENHQFDILRQLPLRLQAHGRPMQRG